MDIFPLEQTGGTVYTKKHFFCPSVSRWKRIDLSQLLNLWSAYQVALWNAYKLLAPQLITSWLPDDYFPHQWIMIKVEEIVLSSSLDEVLTDNKSFYKTGIDFLVFKYGKQNATTFYDAFLKPSTGIGGIKLIKVSFSSLCLLELLLRWSWIACKPPVGF